MDLYIVQELLHYCNISVKKCSKCSQSVIPYYDLTFVLKGSMVYYVNGQKVTLRENDAIFLKPGTLRSRPQGTEPVKYVSFNFLPNPGAELPLAEYLPRSISADVRKLFSVYTQSHILPAYHSKEKVSNLLNYVLFSLLDHCDLETNNEYVIDAIKYVNAHLTEKLSLQEVSAAVNLSKEYISALFKKEMGKTLTDYINERKMMLAVEMIRNEELPLSEIANSLGYGNYTYFIRVFKKYMGEPPIHFKIKKEGV